MAPLRGLPSRSTQPRKSILKRSSGNGTGIATATATATTTTTSDGDSLFPSSKKDKRRIKHALLVDRVSKSSSAKKPRRRRPNKKLVTTLDALADALPSTDDDDDAGAEHGTTATSKEAAGGRPQDQVNIIKRKSMKSRPGAMKRREKVDKGERDRFAKNMAQLVASKSATGTDETKQGSAIKSAVSVSVPPASERLAALRGFIAQTLETRPEFKNSATRTTTK